MKCPNSTIEAPKVKTLAVDPLDPSRSAYIVLPSCDEIRVSGDSFEEPGQLRLSVPDQKIEAVESYPSVQSLDLTNNLIKSFKSSGTDLREINLTQNLLTSLDDFDFPMGLTRLILDVNTIQGFTASVFPDTLSEMYLRKNEIQSLAKFEFPDKINKLNLNGNLQLTSLKGLVLPAGITEFQCQDSGVTDISGVTFPSKIKTFTVSGKTITSFNVRASDVTVLSGMSTLQAGSATTCSADSKLTELKSGISACVYDDTSFAIKFPPPNRKKTEAKSSSSTSSLTPSASAGGSTNVTDATATTAPPTASDNNSSSGGGSDSTQMIIVGVLVLVAVIMGVVIGFIIQRRRKARRSENEGDNTKATRATKTAEQTDGAALATQTLATGFLENDVRNDAALIPYRLPQDEIVIVREIAKGGFGVVFLAKLYSQHVVVKQISPLKTDSGEILRRFMDEIRLYSRLDHPKIVRFIGLSWTNLLDLSLVMEYMPHGDLHSMLRAYKKSPEGTSEFTWFSDHSEPRCKALLALDIAEALVYLHSFNPPIIHRDLKAKNVLLSSDFMAKLGDFGISRETAEETMTGGMGTTAWIAPEVLQGERYTEKADIYSFGILMCEMDTCGHPYNSNRTGEDTLTDAKIAYLVSTASLRPTLADDCPRAIQKLIFECLDFDAERRPTALELHYNLRKVREASLEWGFV